MKPTLIAALLISFLLASCEKEPIDTTFNPPDWILGTWKYEFIHDTAISSGFKFTDKDVCKLDSNLVECFSDIMSSKNSEFKETYTDSSYTVFLYSNYNKSDQLTYKFKKRDERLAYIALGVVELYLDRE